MPDDFYTVPDRAPVYGMNSRDDPKDLKNGEVVSLINAEPGNPPIPRKGMRHWKIANTEDFEYASHFVAFRTTGGTTYLVGWVKDGTDYKLIKINHETKVMTLLGTASDLTDPAFNLIRVFGYIYSIIDEDMSWRGSGFTSRHKIIELSEDFDVVREMCIDVSAGVDSVDKETDTPVFEAGYVGYAFTFVRHTADDAFDSDGLPQILTTFTPGVNESYEDSSSRVVVGHGAPFNTAINLLNSVTDTTYVKAVEFGATHIRVFRTRLKTSEVLATSSLAVGEGYFLVDLPIPAPVPHLPLDIAGIELTADNYKLVIAAHGLSAGTALISGLVDFDMLEGMDLPEWSALELIRDITIDDDDTIQVTNSWDEQWEDYAPSSGAYITTEYQNIIPAIPSLMPVILHDGERIRIRTVTPHGLSPGDIILFHGVPNGDGPAGVDFLGNPVGEDYVYAQYRDNNGSTWGPWTNLYKRSDLWNRINGVALTVHLLISTTSFYVTEYSDDYMKPFIPATQDELDYIAQYSFRESRVYEYTHYERTPQFTYGYIGLKMQLIETSTDPGNVPVVTTETDHRLNNDHSVRLLELTDGATELNGFSGRIEIVDDTSFKLRNQSTSGISPWISGGIVRVAIAEVYWADTVTDNTLAGELASIVTTDYSAAPKGGFVEYADERMWIFGLLSEEKGRAIYSERIGGSGGTPLSDAVAFPQKFASMFKYDYFVDFSVKKGYLPTGMIRLASDLYFYFEGETYALFTSNPIISVPTLVNGEIGCAFPETLKVCDIPIYGGQCLLFLSNLGPAITRQGGETFLFNDFKIKELWPKANRELYDDLESNTGRNHIINNCSAVFHKNRYIITYKNADGEAKIFVYYFNPETRENPNAEHGSYQINLAKV